MTKHREVPSVSSRILSDLLKVLLPQYKSFLFLVCICLSSLALTITTGHALCLFVVFLDSTKELKDFIGGHADLVIRFNKVTSEPAISKVGAFLALNYEKLQTSLWFCFEDCSSVGFDPVFWRRFLENLNYTLSGFTCLYILPDVQCTLVLGALLVEKCHGFFCDFLVFKLRLVKYYVHLFLNQHQVVTLVLPTAELVKELKNLFSPPSIILEVEAYQGCLHKWHNLLERPLFLHLDAVLVSGPSWVLEFSLFVIVFAQLGQIFLV